ncbi:MAG: uroporphyrinogen decarboxylase [Bacteroidales bacterium]|jgi:uroporphyrinogen decarboxylase|nr:uroporphyrinogen decarboxylase [Bacteroidales bacterium]
MNSVFLDILQGKPTPRPAVWFMRQAGRVLPDYNRMRAHFSFADILADPNLSAEVTLMPVEALGVDAAILFSDILVVPQALGMSLSFTDHGPEFSAPLLEMSNPCKALKADTSGLETVYQTVRNVKKQAPNVPLIGFAGAPHTLLCYMLQGSARNNFTDALKYMCKNPGKMKKLMEAVTEIIIEFAMGQIDAGIDAFQLFDTHAGMLPEHVWFRDSRVALERISTAVRSRGIPLIIFPKGITAVCSMLEGIADVVSVDWKLPLEIYRNIIPASVGIQGNMDPRIMCCAPRLVGKEILNAVDFFMKHPRYIFNLGHGLFPDSQLENVKMAVDLIKGINAYGE